MKNQHASNTPARSIALWIAGGMLTVGSLISVITASNTSCSTEGVSCEVNSLVWLTAGFLGLFVGVILVLAGFAARAKHRESNEDARLAQIIEMAKQEIAAEKQQSSQQLNN